MHKTRVYRWEHLIIGDATSSGIIQVYDENGQLVSIIRNYCFENFPGRFTSKILQNLLRPANHKKMVGLIPLHFEIFKK
jgi:hypothetical protein